MKNQVQLITYVDRLGGGGLRQLQELLRGPLRDLFGGVHLLPFFYPIDGADAGFDPVDHTQVDVRLGSWADVRGLAADVELMADVIVNHVSSESPQFRDFSNHGANSKFSGMFLTHDAVFPGGASAADLKRIYRPRPGLPFTQLQMANGEQKVLWTTFTPQQIDIDVNHAEGCTYLESILRTFSDNGIRMIRLDAVGYAIKKAGTNCFMLPETFAFIDEFAAKARALGIEVLVEIHSYFRQQIEIARRVDRVYDFALPPLVLHAFACGTAGPLKEWARIRPDNCLTVLDTHDGIGIIDVGADSGDREGRPGLVPPDELDRLVEFIHRNSGNDSRRATGAAASNLDLYQVNCTFYDALGRDDLWYLLARALQFFLPGIPQVYYVGLLAGENDLALLERSGVGRDINRHYFSMQEINSSLRRPVVQVLLDLIRLRNSHPAFDGACRLRETGTDVLALRWERAEHFAELEINFRSSRHKLDFSEGGELRQWDLGARLDAAKA